MPLTFTIIEIGNITDPNDALAPVAGTEIEGGSAGNGSTLSFDSIGDVSTTVTGNTFTDDGSILADPITLNGTTYSAGTGIETDYSFVAYDAAADLYFMVSHVSIGNQFVGAVLSRGFDLGTDGFSDLYTPGNTLSIIDPDLVPPSPGWDSFIQGEQFNTGNDQLYDNDIDIFDNPGLVICFASGTRIALATGGEARIETLVPGQSLRCADGTVHPIRWIGQSHVTATQLAQIPTLRPILIRAGALGPNLPRRDLRVSRQHRMVVASPIALRMFEARDVLVPAIQLVGLPGVEIDTAATSVTYFHLLLDGHKILTAEGAPSESLFLGPQAFRAMSPAARAEIRQLFADDIDWLKRGESALLIPRPKQQKRLIARHKRNNKPLVNAA